MEPAFSTSPFRAFLGISFSEAVQQQLYENLKPYRHSFGEEGIRWVPAENYHLTLWFLGALAPEQSAKIQEALAEGARSWKPFLCHWGNLGAFPSVRRPRILWVECCDEGKGFASLVEQIHSRIGAWTNSSSKAGEEFIPHVTVARVKQGGGVLRKWKDVTRKPLAMQGDSILVNALSLFRSDLSQEGARYSEVARISLRG